MAAIYRIAGLGRLPLGTPYPGVVAALVRIMSRMPPFTPLLIDASGVGRAIVDMMVDAGLQPCAVTITGGNDVLWHHANSVSVPKLTLVSKLVAIAHSGQLLVHQDLADWPTLRRELENYRGEVTRSGRGLTFNAPSGQHDDLLISAALCAWHLQGTSQPGAAIFEHYRNLAGAGGQERHVVAADLGQSNDPSAVCFMTRVSVPDIRDAPAPGFRAAGDDRPAPRPPPQPGNAEWLEQQQQQASK
jgi:hypothetical protein